MKTQGFTLVELLIVIVLIGILSTIGTFAFSEYTRKTQITSQTRTLYGDLMEYRLKALYEKKNWTFKINAASYGIYSSANTAVAPVTTTTLKNSVTFNNTTDVVYDSQGLANVSGKTVCVSAANDAPVDSLVISFSRVQIGKKKVGTSCAAANIDAQ